MARADDDTMAQIGTIRDSGMPTNEQGDAFGAWLLKQTKCENWIGTLAKSAKADLRFRGTISPDDLHKKLQEADAEGDSFKALDDAEVEWLSE